MAASNAPPRTYAPATYPAMQQSVPRWIIQEFAKIELAILGLSRMTPQEATEEPQNPQRSMIRRAMAPWRPVLGQTDDAWVWFEGTAWVYL